MSNWLCSRLGFGSVSLLRMLQNHEFWSILAGHAHVWRIVGSEEFA